MKNTILVLSILLSSMIQAQVYYQAIGESMKEKSNYDVTVTDLYGNYNQYQVQIENLNPSTKVYTGNTYTEGYGTDGYGDFGDIALQAARVARRQKQANQNDFYSKRIRYLEFELRSALNVIKNQSYYINILKTNSELEQMLADKQIEILKMEINDFRMQLGLPPIFEESKPQKSNDKAKPPKINDKDCNGDGVVSMEEMINGKGCDCDGDGIVSFKEATSGCK